jgi:hypothetical protein
MLVNPSVASVTDRSEMLCSEIVPSASAEMMDLRSGIETQRKLAVGMIFEKFLSQPRVNARFSLALTTHLGEGGFANQSFLPYHCAKSP